MKKAYKLTDEECHALGVRAIAAAHVAWDKTGVPKLRMGEQYEWALHYRGSRVAVLAIKLALRGRLRSIDYRAIYWSFIYGMEAGMDDEVHPFSIGGHNMLMTAKIGISLGVGI